MISHQGLERFYTLGGRGLAPNERYDAPGDAELQELSYGVKPRLSLQIQGLHCAACAWLVRSLFDRQEGALSLRIDSFRGRLDLEVAPQAFDVGLFARRLAQFGYRISLTGQEPSSSTLWWIPGLSLALSMNVMLLTLPLYFGMAVTDPNFATLSLVAMALTGFHIVVCGGTIIRQAVLASVHRVPHLDLPLALGLVLGLVASVVAWRAGRVEGLYFDSISVLLTLVLIGRALQKQQLNRLRSGLQTGEFETNWRVLRLVSGIIEPTPLAKLESGDEYLVASGGVVPVESYLLGSQPEVFDPSWVTGESTHQRVQPGDKVPAGLRVGHTGGLRLLANEGWRQSRLHDLLSVPALGTDDAAQPVWLRRTVRWFVPTVLCLAFGGGLLWWTIAGSDQAIEVVVAVLVLSCPCALALGMPLAWQMASSCMLGQGLVVRSNTFFAQGPRVRRLIFDKTGTLTTVEPSLRNNEVLVQLAPRYRRLLAGMVVCSTHPRSVVVLQALGKRIEYTRQPVEEHPGQGLLLQTEEGTFRLGSHRFAVQSDPGGTDGDTWFTIDGKVLARLSFAETMPTSERDMLIKAHQMGYELTLLSGDSIERVKDFQEHYGVPFRHALGGLRPEDKAAWLAETGCGSDLYCGDGVNDLPVMREASIACAPAAGQPVVPSRCDLLLLRRGVAGVLKALWWSRQVEHLTRQLLVFGLMYNALAMGVALAGWMKPWIAAVAMPVSSLVVIAWIRFSRRRLLLNEVVK